MPMLQSSSLVMSTISSLVIIPLFRPVRFNVPGRALTRVRTLRIPSPWRIRTLIQIQFHLLSRLRLQPFREKHRIIRRQLDRPFPRCTCGFLDSSWRGCRRGRGGGSFFTLPRWRSVCRCSSQIRLKRSRICRDRARVGRWTSRSTCMSAEHLIIERNDAMTTAYWHARRPLWKIVWVRSSSGLKISDYTISPIPRERTHAHQRPFLKHTNTDW